MPGGGFDVVLWSHMKVLRGGVTEDGAAEIAVAKLTASS